MGRAITTAAPDGTTTTNSYDGLSTMVTDANNNSTTSLTDVMGRTLSITPPTGPSVAFTYDAIGNMLTASRGGVTTTLAYDNAGRKLTMNDPDMGLWQYQYDALGNMTSQIDARNCTTGFTYDLLTRQTQKTYSNCPTTSPVTYNYDSGTNGIGRRTSVSDDSGLTVWTYDIRGRVTKEAKQIDSNQFVTSFAYNSADLPVSMTYPDGEVVNFTYNNQMMLTSVLGTDSYLQSAAYDSAGRITQRVLGANKITSNFNYFAWNTPNGGGRLQSAAHTNSALTLQTFSYTYDPVGNIMGINDALSGETQSFAYDALDRLTSASAVAGLGNYSENYAYNSTTGNLETKGNLALQYADLGHVHAVTSAGSNSYQYDANGNQTTRIIGVDTFTLFYDAENRLIEVKKNDSTVAQFTYDGDGKRVKSVIDSETILFVGAHYEKQGTNVTKYYLAGAQRIAVRKNGTLNYLLGDHLGSTSITTDANGNRVSETRYKAWGESRFSEGPIPTKYLYTGQYSNVDDFGLVFYGARWYDNLIGRFTQPDTVMSPNVQGLDRYAYVNNNPIRYTDPSGHSACDQYDDDGNCIDETSNHTTDVTRYLLETQFGWSLEGRWSFLEIKLLLAAAFDILRYVNGIAPGKGQAWMNKYMGGTTFVHGSLFGNSFVTGRTVHLADGWINGGSQDAVHELGHIYDNNSSTKSGVICAPVWCGGGNADRMYNLLTGEDPSGIRWKNGTSPNGYEWPGQPNTPATYGNTATAEYFAEVFEHAVYGLSIPQSNGYGGQAILESLITDEASVLP